MADKKHSAGFLITRLHKNEGYRIYLTREEQDDQNNKEIIIQVFETRKFSTLLGIKADKKIKILKIEKIEKSEDING